MDGIILSVSLLDVCDKSYGQEQLGAVFVSLDRYSLTVCRSFFEGVLALFLVEDRLSQQEKI